MRTRLALLTLAAILTPLSALAQGDAPAPRTLSVSGQGEVRAAPDLAVVSFAVETTSPAASAAVAENASKSTVLADALKQALSGNGKVSTTGYALDPVYEPRERGGAPTPPRITGYIARNQVRAETHAIDSVGKLIDAATKAGANRVDGLEFTLEERTKAQNDALQRAGQDARRQAEAAAAALGVTLGKIVRVDANASPIMPRQFRLGMAHAEMAATTPVEAGDVSVTANLQVTYEIQ